MCIYIYTSLVVKKKLDLRAAIEVFDVVESPSGDVVSAEGDIHCFFGRRRQCCGGEHQQAKGEAAEGVRSHVCAENM